MRLDVGYGFLVSISRAATIPLGLRRGATREPMGVHHRAVRPDRRAGLTYTGHRAHGAVLHPGGESPQGAVRSCITAHPYSTSSNFGFGADSGLRRKVGEVCATIGSYPAIRLTAKLLSEISATTASNVIWPSRKRQAGPVLGKPGMWIESLELRSYKCTRLSRCALGEWWRR